MAIEKSFRKISVEVSGVLSIKKTPVIIRGAEYTDTHYQLHFTYNNKTINISNRVGVSEVGRIESAVCNTKKSLEFKLTTRDHFTILFLGKANRFKLHSKNKNIHSFFRNSPSWQILKRLANETGFVPIFLGKNTEEGFSLITEYNLDFPTKERALEPLIALYKEFINAFG